MAWQGRIIVQSVSSTFFIIFLYQFSFTNFSAGANFVSPTLNFTVPNSKPFTDLAVVDTAGQKAYQYKYITSFWTVRAECVRKFSKRSRASFRTRVQSKTLSNFSGTFLVSTSWRHFIVRLKSSNQSCYFSGIHRSTWFRSFFAKRPWVTFIFLIYAARFFLSIEHAVLNNQRVSRYKIENWWYETELNLNFGIFVNFRENKDNTHCLFLLCFVREHVQSPVQCFFL